MEDLKELAQEARDLLSHGLIEEKDLSEVTPLLFFRYVSLNKPLLIKNGARHWRAFSQWGNNDYLKEKAGGNRVTVAVTPNGYADSVAENGYFALPLYETMEFRDFMEQVIESPSPTARGVHYIQLQNNSLNLEFSNLLEDVEPDVPFATEALGKEPDAVNIWVGEENSVTSLHKDPYENLYCVVTGKKHFVLYPPTEFPFLHEGLYQPASYVRNSQGLFELKPDPEQPPIPWIPVDPLYPNLEKHPRFHEARGYSVTVEAGDMLYLPSLYYHHVTQSNDAEGKCVAVNYWYDMDFDLKYAYFMFMSKVARKALGDPSPPPPPSSSNSSSSSSSSSPPSSSSPG